MIYWKAISGSQRHVAGRNILKNHLTAQGATSNDYRANFGNRYQAPRVPNANNQSARCHQEPIKTRIREFCDSYTCSKTCKMWTGCSGKLSWWWGGEGAGVGCWVWGGRACNWIFSTQSKCAGTWLVSSTKLFGEWYSVAWLLRYRDIHNSRFQIWTYA